MRSQKKKYSKEDKEEIMKRIEADIKSGASVRQACLKEKIYSNLYYLWIKSRSKKASNEGIVEFKNRVGYHIDVKKVLSDIDFFIECSQEIFTFTPESKRHLLVGIEKIMARNVV